MHIKIKQPQKNVIRGCKEAILYIDLQKLLVSH